MSIIARLKKRSPRYSPVSPGEETIRMVIRLSSIASPYWSTRKVYNRTLSATSATTVRL